MSLEKVRAGIGFDVHRFSSDRPLVLGGVKIPYSLGLGGHSDADVALHAVIDAMLGAVAAGDIGFHFPSTDGKYKDISSLELLKETNDIVEKKGFKLVNLDVVIILEEPELQSYRGKMKDSISRTLGVQPNQISVKATTTEGLGFTGRREGIAAKALALVEEV